MHYPGGEEGVLIFYADTSGLEPWRSRCRGRSGASGSGFAYSLLLLALERWKGASELPELGSQPGGKPYFPGHPDWHFSLSHTEGMVLAAVSDFPVGADVQRIDTRGERLAPKLMSDSERKDFDFFTLWALREACYKLTGRGDLRTMRFSMTCSGILAPEPGVRCRTYRLPGCAAAAACFEGDLPDEPIRVPIEEICS